MTGDNYTGKSAIMTVFAEKKMPDIPTFGIDLKPLNINIDGKIIKLYIWDATGGEHFGISDSSYVLYKLTNNQTQACT